MRREGTPAWMQVVGPRWEQAAEEGGAGMLGGYGFRLSATGMG